jgi:hypothetical protein
MLTALAAKPPASAGYRGSDLVPWRTGVSRRLEQMTASDPWPKF